MVTNVKMQVTPDLSRRVQEIVFANGGRWLDGGNNICEVEARYLYIEMEDFSGRDTTPILSFEENCFISYTESSLEEISAYDFIASNGEQKWLPKYKEMVLFSKDKKKWVKGIFIGYTVEVAHPFTVESKGIHKYCSPLDEKLVFKDFLEEKGISFDKFLENCKPENQRWGSAWQYYNRIKKLQERDSEDWLDTAFSFEYNLLGLSVEELMSISDEWELLIAEANKIGRGVVWSEEDGC